MADDLSELQKSRRARAASAAENQVPEPDEPAPAADLDPEAERRAFRRARFLAGIPADVAATISDDELEKIEAEETARAQAEAKKSALSIVRDNARQRARVEADLVSADTLRSEAEQARRDEEVTFVINISGDAAGSHGPPGIRVDGFTYQIGHTYTRPRHVADSLQETVYRHRLAEIEFSTINQRGVAGLGEEMRARPAVILLSRNPVPFEVGRAA